MERFKGVGHANWLEETRVIAILRAVPMDAILEVADALYDRGY